MPRNVSDIYYIPPGTEGFPDTTIESEKYNNYIHDVEDDLNRPRPISSGGTGANDADEALANLHAEKAGQQVTNFDTHVWMAGSFYSTISATAPPVANHAFSGIAHITDANNMVVEAVDLTDPLHKQWMRIKTAGMWGAWVSGITAITCADDPPTGNNALDNALWFESTSGLLFIMYNDGDSRQWTIACPQPDISTYALKTDITNLEANKVDVAGDTMIGALVLAPDAPTLDLEAVNKKYVDDRILVAADALSYSGMQINGSMDVSQEYGTADIDNATGYTLDGWSVAKAGASVVRVTQAQIGAMTAVTGFPYAAVLIATTAEPSLAAGSYVALEQPIEGWRVNKLGWGNTNANPITIGFWSSNSRAGTYTVAVRNADSTRSYCATYTQDVSGAPQYNVVTIPGCTDGVWQISIFTGMIISFTAASGATFTAPAVNTWQSGNYLAAPGQVNGVAAVNDQLAITGVVVLPGDQPLTAERSALVMRPYDQELLTCQRYYVKLVGSEAPPNGGPLFTLVTVGGAGWYCANVVFWPVQMRAVPTVALFGGWTVTNGTAMQLSNGGITNQGINLYVQALAAGPVFVYPHDPASGLAVDARL